MSIAKLYFKRTFVKDIAVETSWYRVPMSDTYEWKTCREYSLERTGSDPLDIRTTTIYKLKGNKIEVDRSNNPKSIATVSYLNSASKDDLLLAHTIVVATIDLGLLPQNGDLDRWLQQQHVGALASKLIN